jgi:hypothetical protein
MDKVVMVQVVVVAPEEGGLKGVLLGLDEDGKRWKGMVDSTARGDESFIEWSPAKESFYE